MTVVDINIHHLPEDLFTNQKILDGFLYSAPRGFGEIARVETMDSGKRHLILEKPAGYQNLNYVEGDYSAEAKLAAMRAHATQIPDNSWLYGIAGDFGGEFMGVEYYTLAKGERGPGSGPYQWEDDLFSGLKIAVDTASR